MHKLLLDLPSELTTARLCVRPYRAGDGAAYFDVCQRNRQHLLPYEKGNPALSVNTPEEAEILMRRYSADFVARAAFFFGAFLRTDGSFAAQIYLGPVNWELPEFELGYFADRDHQGRGLVTEAASAVIALAFGPMGAQRLRLSTNDTNLRSQRVAERCGFVREGHLRQTRRHPPGPDGACSGDVLYGMLRQEFLTRTVGK